jgi:RNA recognition motif-containing protein
MPKKLFIASLPSNVNKKDMHNIFSQYGKIKRVEMVTQKGSNRCKGFAFVTYHSEQVANTVLNTEIFFQGRKLSVREQLKGSQLKAYKQNFCKRRMFIGNIPSGVTDSELRDRFREFGLVETGYVIKDHRTGLNSNFGYILFKDQKVLQHVITLEIRIHDRVVSCQEFKGKKSKITVKDCQKLSK